ncbi:DUF5947 family protein [Streptomyces sp. NPDC048182]|uniref:DUF5947 family protein n=1 Tax=Streptomyces sp. NPDC048182 TaxID=3365507 RepID=UPI003717877A
MSVHPAVPGTAAAPRGLARFAAPRGPREERCELCAAVVGEGHRHLVDVERRALACACGPCATLLDRSSEAGSGEAGSGVAGSGVAGGGRFRAVPDRYLADPAHRVDEQAWERLRIPVGVAFFFRNSALDKLVALYPSPAGATESELEEESWASVLDGTALAGQLRPDVEALLLRRHEGRVECFLVPIDICYELVGRMRLTWQGFDGGAEARADLAAFFAHVRERARDLPRDLRGDGE